jgi:cytochrome c peroxidase
MAVRVILGFAAMIWLGLGGVALADMADWRRPLTIPFPADAPYDPRIAGLGKMLFFDPRLSGGQNISCASCHNPSFGWETPVAGPIGAANMALPRSAPTTLNVAYTGPDYFWDGRAHSLEEQAGGPITTGAEMDSSFDEIVQRLSAVPEYKQWFDKLFPGEGMTEATIRRSLATFERTVVTGWSPFDRWVEGDATAISVQAQRGFALFTGVAGCANCHKGWNFTDGQYDDIGLPGIDRGRAVVTRDKNDNYKFKSPSLRNIALRAPYMHNGSLPTLEAVIKHYASGGINRPTKAPDLTPFDVTEEQVQDIIAFLNSLTEEETIVFTPILPAN